MPAVRVIVPAHAAVEHVTEIGATKLFESPTDTAEITGTGCVRELEPTSDRRSPFASGIT